MPHMDATIWRQPVTGKCFTASLAEKKAMWLSGDSINATPTAKGQAVIESINERRSLLYRSDQYKSKLLAANIDQLFIVVATEPGFSDDLVSRALVAAEAAGNEGPSHSQQNRYDRPA